MAAVVLVADVMPEKGILEATIVPPDIVPVQVKSPLEFVTVQPVDPLPPAIPARNRRLGNRATSLGPSHDP